MEYNLGMMSARPEGPRVERGTCPGGSEWSPCLLQGLRGIVTSPGLRRDPTKFYCAAFLGLELCIRNGVKWR